MTDFSHQKKIVDEAKKFADQELRPFATEFDVNEKLPHELINKMAKKGYIAASFPEEFGGLALDPVWYGLFTEVIGKACCSTRGLITVHTSLVGETLIRWGTEEQKNYWLPLMAKGEKIGAFALTEPEVGTDAKSVQTSYYKKGDSYIISGSKKWITFGDIADFFIVIASEEGNISAFIIEREFNGVSTSPMKGLLASRASHIAEIEFNNVKVPGENLLGKLGNGFTYIVSTALDHGRYSIAWAGAAIAQEALETMVTYSRTRRQFGKKIFNFQLIQGIIADAATKVHAARSLCLRAGEMRKEKNQDAMLETTIAKYFSSKIAMQVAIDAVQVHGGNGCYNRYPVERLFREAKILEIIEGTSQVQQKIISEYALRKYFRRD